VLEQFKICSKNLDISYCSKFKAANKYWRWCTWDPIQLVILCTTCNLSF